jgi:hypothetical protein
VLPRDSVAHDNSQSQSDNAQADAVALDPVLTIEIGAASNSISIERATGTATVHYEPSLVKVTIAPDIASALGLTQEQSVITVTPDQEICLLPAPLESCISVAHGSQSTDENGVTHADASGVSVHLLTGVQNGITLNLAATHVEGVGALDTARVAEEPPLARTGGTVDALLGGGLFAVAIGGMMLVRRSRRHALI